MSARNLLSGTNVMFLLAAAYFLIMAALGEGSTYAVSGTALCLLAVLVSLRKTVVSDPWRVATASFSLVLFVVQLEADFTSKALSNASILASTLINGAFFLIFLGVLLSTTREMMRKATEEEEETPKESKKLTYEV